MLHFMCGYHKILYFTLLPHPTLKKGGVLIGLLGYLLSYCITVSEIDHESVH